MLNETRLVYYNFSANDPKSRLFRMRIKVKISPKTCEIKIVLAFGLDTWPLRGIWQTWTANLHTV